MASDRQLGLVLSGGGARGAYEIGVLCYVADHHPELLSRINIVTGTSVGAVNAVFLASHGLDAQSVRHLAALWRGLELDELLSLSRGSLMKLVGAASISLVRDRGRSPATGVLAVSRLFRLIHQVVDWRGLRRHLDSGRFEALAIGATDIATGATHLFVDGEARHAGTLSDVEVVRTRIELRHVAASAAIPILFPPVRAEDRWYMDGGLRHNTPLNPAIHLGAEGLVIIGVRGVQVPAATDIGEFPGLGQVLGKVLDAVFLDRVGFDLDRLERINDLLTIADEQAPDGARKIQAELRRRGRRPYRVIPFVSVQPKGDLGSIAASEIGRKPGRSGTFRHLLHGLFQNDRRSSADAASFLLFDGDYADLLIKEGYKDAALVEESWAAL